MEPLLILLGFVFGAMWVIGVPYLLISHMNLKSRVRDLEDIISRIGARTPSPKAEYEPISEEDVSKLAPAPKSVESGPWSAAKAPDKTPPPVAETVDEPDLTPVQDAFVMRLENVARLTTWLRENWALAVAAVSLALGAIFMVQYGAENGLLSPFWRVIGTLTIGAALITGGEYIRRRHGDDIAETATRYLPSTFAGAGIFALFAGVLAARVLYDLISAPTTMIGLVGVSVIAIVLGWFYGPVLAAIGIIGATTAPFLVGDASDSAWIFYYYFAALTIAGLTVDTVKRWAWTTALTLIATVGAATLLYEGLGQAEHFMTFFLIAFVGSIAIPVRAVWPCHDGMRTLDVIMGSRTSYEFPTRVAAAMTIAICIAGFVATLAASTPWIGFGALFIVLMLCLIWMRFAPALEDLAAAPATALVAVIAVFPETRYFGELLYEGGTLIGSAAVVVAGAALASIVAYRRMMLATGETRVLVWTLAAAGFAPLVVFLVEFMWVPDLMNEWAMIVIGVAAVMTVLATKTATAPASDTRQMQIAIFAASAIVMIVLSSFILLTKSPLTLALGGVLILSALLDRRFDLRILTYVAQLGVAVIGFRLIVDPGYFWATEITSLMQATIAYVGAMGCTAVAWVLFGQRDRTATRATLESGLWTFGAVFVCVLLHRALGPDFNNHAAVGLVACVWAVSMMAQLYRLSVSTGIVRIFRIVLASIFGLITLGILVAMATTVNPLFVPHQIVHGPMVFDSLAVAYLPLAAILAFGAWRIPALHPNLRIGFICGAAALALAYVGLEIRRFWQGDRLSVPTVGDGELYTYTVAMLLAAVGLLFTAFFRRSDLLRKVAMGAVAVTIAKVFLVDMSGLTGLIRVASFMGLGLGLAGLAWLNRKMTAQWDQAPDPDA